MEQHVAAAWILGEMTVCPRRSRVQSSEMFLDLAAATRHTHTRTPAHAPHKHRPKQTDTPQTPHHTCHTHATHTHHTGSRAHHPLAQHKLTAPPKSARKRAAIEPANRHPRPPSRRRSPPTPAVFGFFADADGARTSLLDTGLASRLCRAAAASLPSHPAGIPFIETKTLPTACQAICDPPPWNQCLVILGWIHRG